MIYFKKYLFLNCKVYYTLFLIIMQQEILKKLKQQSTITYNITSRKDINPITGEINYEITNWTVKI